MKLYPFSVRKHAHDVEYRKNYVWCLMQDMETGYADWDEEAYEKMAALLDGLRDLLCAIYDSRDGKVAYLTGPQIALAKETVLWAAEQRHCLSA